MNTMSRSNGSAFVSMAAVNFEIERETGPNPF